MLPQEREFKREIPKSAAYLTLLVLQFPGASVKREGVRYLELRHESGLCITYDLLRDLWHNHDGRGIAGWSRGAERCGAFFEANVKK